MVVTEGVLRSTGNSDPQSAVPAARRLLLLGYLREQTFAL